MSATIGRDRVDNLVLTDWHPSPIHFDFVVVANHTTSSRTTIGVIAARTSVIQSVDRPDRYGRFRHLAIIR
jgi:hypothetical protein